MPSRRDGRRDTESWQQKWQSWATRHLHCGHCRPPGSTGTQGGLHGYCHWEERGRSWQKSSPGVRQFPLPVQFPGEEDVNHEPAAANTLLGDAHCCCKGCWPCTLASMPTACVYEEKPAAITFHPCPFTQSNTKLVFRS